MEWSRIAQELNLAFFTFSGGMFGFPGAIHNANAWDLYPRSRLWPIEVQSVVKYFNRKDVVGPYTITLPFGSSVYNRMSWTCEDDIDLTLLPRQNTKAWSNNGRHVLDFSRSGWIILTQLIDKLQNSEAGACVEDIEFVRTAAVPVVRLQFMLHSQKAKKIKVDITYNNGIGLLNTLQLVEIFDAACPHRQRLHRLCKNLVIHMKEQGMVGGLDPSAMPRDLQGNAEVKDAKTGMRTPPSYALLRLVLDILDFFSPSYPGWWVRLPKTRGQTVPAGIQHFPFLDKETCSSKLKHLPWERMILWQLASFPFNDNFALSDTVTKQDLLKSLNHANAPRILWFEWSNALAEFPQRYQKMNINKQETLAKSGIEEKLSEAHVCIEQLQEALDEMRAENRKLLEIASKRTVAGGESEDCAWKLREDRRQAAEERIFARRRAKRDLKKTTIKTMKMNTRRIERYLRYFHKRSGEACAFQMHKRSFAPFFKQMCWHARCAGEEAEETYEEVD